MCQISVGEGCVRVGETVWNTLRVDEIEKRERETKILKGRKAGSRDGCLKIGAGWNSLTNIDTIYWEKTKIIKKFPKK